MIEQCETCMFFNVDSGYGPDYDGACRRYPATFISWEATSSVGYPPTKFKSWCGEFKSIESYLQKYGCARTS